MASIMNTPARLLDSTPQPSQQSQSPRLASRQVQTSQRSNNQRLDQIEGQIAIIEERLKQVKADRERVSPDSQEHVALEEQRKQLKKELIDLDYQHQMCFEISRAENGDASSQKEEQATALRETPSQLESRIIQSQLDYSRKVQEELEKIQTASLAREEQLRKLFANELNRQQNPSDLTYENEKSEAQLDKQLAEARYRSKLAELELSLTSDALRRSRQLQLEAQLESLRLLNPLDWYSRLELSVPLYPSYYIDPLVLSYDPLLFPSSGLYY